LICREAAYLDQRKWQEWLDLFLPDAEFWLPAWDDEQTLTDDPKSQISLMYYDSRSGLEDRVSRIVEGSSAASNPLPRTCHIVSTIRIEEEKGNDVRVGSSWMVHEFRSGKTQTFYGWYDHLLRFDGDKVRIAKKKVVVVNDVIPHVLDIYNI
jgi:3-phenylpropionate/cinnamic acid dioxygenase small subunit